MLFNTNENSLPQQVIINKNNIDANTKAIELIGELDTEGIAALTADVLSLKTTTTKNTDDIEVNKSNISQNSTDIEVNMSNIRQNSTDIEVNKSNISQNSTDIEVVKITADSALSKTEYDYFNTIVTSGGDYVSIPELASYKRIEIQYAARNSSTGLYVYSASSMVQMGAETADFFQPYVTLIWSTSIWAHIGGFLSKADNRLYPLYTTLSRGTGAPTNYISYGIKVTIRCYK